MKTSREGVKAIPDRTFIVSFYADSRFVEPLTPAPAMGEEITLSW
jgi:hypothetical protein